MNLEKVIRIEIEKNNYSTGSLNFRIWDPEEEKYGKVNSFSEQNELLRFTEEQRSMADYAYELIAVIFNTYYSMDKVILVYNGALNDFKILRSARNRFMNEQKKAGKMYPVIELEGESVNDPQEITELINSLINEVNSKLTDSETVRVFDIAKIRDYLYVDLKSLSEIECYEDEKDFVISANRTLRELSDNSALINGYNRRISDLKKEYEKSFKDLKAVKTYEYIAEKTFKKSLIPVDQVAKQIKNKNNMDEIIKKYQDYPHVAISSSKLKALTKEICKAMYDSLLDIYLTCFVDLWNDIQKKACQEATSEIDNLLGLKDKDFDVEFKPINKSDESNPIIQEMRKVIDNSINSILNNYDSGELSISDIFRNGRKKSCVGVSYVASDMHNINIKEYVNYYSGRYFDEDNFWCPIKEVYSYMTNDQMSRFIKYIKYEYRKDLFNKYTEKYSDENNFDADDKLTRYAFYNKLERNLTKTLADIQTSFDDCCEQIKGIKSQLLGDTPEAQK